MSLFLATNANDGFNYAFGIGKASLAAFTAGVASVPTPFTEAAYSGWLWHTMGFIGSPVAGAEGTTRDTLIISIDSKAMRKLEADEVLYLAGEFGEVGTATMIVKAATRMLFKQS